MTKRDRVAGEIPYYGATGILDYVNDFIFDEPLVLVGEDGAKWGPGENSAFAVSGRCWVNNHAHVLRPRRNHVLDSWLIYFLNYSDLMDFVSGLTVPKLNQGSLREIPIPVPPLPEQHRIVALLDEAFAGIAKARENTERNLENAREVFDSFLEGVFSRRGKGWVRSRLSDHLETMSTGPFGTMLHKSDYVSDGIPLVNPMNLVDGRIVPSRRMMVSPETRVRLGNYLLSHEDIVIARRGELGRCAVVTKKEIGWLCGTGSLFIHLRDSLEPEFCGAFFRSPAVRKGLDAASVGTTMNNLNQGIMEALEVPIPPIEEQRVLLARFKSLRESVNHLTALCQRKLAALDALKQSLLHQAFHGDL